MVAEISIPKRAVFKPAEVCTIAGVQPYILMSWETEFSTLARPKRKGGDRVYRRVDVEMVLRIKALVYGEGLTLGAAHRKLDAGQQPPPSVDGNVDCTEEPRLVGLFDADTRDRIVWVKQGLRGILELLSPNGQTAQPPVPNKPKEAVKQTGSIPRAKEDKTIAKKAVKTPTAARAAKTSKAVKATKAAKPKKVVKRKRTA